MNFDLRYVPFSRYNSFFVFSKLQQDDTQDYKVYIRNVSSSFSRSNIFRIDLIYNNEIIPYTERCSPYSLKLISDKGFMEFIISDENTIRFRGAGVGLRLSVETTKYDCVAPYDSDKLLLTYATSNTKFMMIPLKATKVDVSAPWDVSRCTSITMDFVATVGNTVEGIIDNFLTEWDPKDFSKTSFEEDKKEIKHYYYGWLLNSTHNCHPKYHRGNKLASYITWSCVVPPRGNLTRKAMYMSKNWMTSIWSWDNCFNALALSTTFPELALEQFMIFFDHQDKSGSFPDLINDSKCIWSFNKPPVQGIIMKEIMDKTEEQVFSLETLEKIYQPMCLWTRWWLDFNDFNHNGVPQYKHGNDCGWDNSTVFHNGVPIESPDLLSFLILQFEFLALVAEKLGKHEESKKHYETAKENLVLLIKHFWTKDGFVARHNNGSICNTGDSLLLFVPIILGKRLPSYIRDYLVSGLKEEGRFFTENGLATESVKSPFYEPDGYWRGPIWAPSTFLIVRGLEACGEFEFAWEIKKRFCEMCNKEGMAENFDAISGEGLRDKAFTWTSSVFLVFSRELNERI
ncbi:hypothetical protein SAMN02745248_02267 [Hathewaya proteolytica DSM 3090]|uniref:Mannosylglycerate hydrolase MGH1-like glycoside hydrolase domain-containing protein n=1 Tax=Hathewaya proteolytica DSM 3090 TaxID=1121331 RepID=A0A1M6RF66_9CLOT|nr:hypothetical protein [Hathewaya proteolytica]SHK31050.1 hypothetical protein SAMN02745248_02267 [Hathewaya proteolytica DSM 3090]